MLTYAQIENTIDIAEQELDWCWEFLAKLKSRKIGADLADNIRSFQPRLLKAILVLDRQYRDVVGEKNFLIGRKQKYKQAWFSRRMAKLDAYLRAITNVIGLAKTIGDGFIWIFYQGDPILIDQHLSLQKQKLLPPGIGGDGERAFIEKFPHFGGHFVLYHGLTSILRLGDVSFYDFNERKITSIGELKTKKVGENEYQITVAFVAGEAIHREVSKVKRSKKKKAVPLSPTMRQRLIRQIEEISAAFEREKSAVQNDQHSEVSGQFHFSELDKVLSSVQSKRAHFEVAGSSLILFCVRDGRRKKLSSRLLRANARLLDGAFDELLPTATSIAKADTSENALFLDTLGFDDIGFPKVWPGAVPMVWWPINSNNLKKLVFSKAYVLTIYNPCWFWSSLREAGYDVEIGEGSKIARVHRKIGSQICELENVDYYQRLVQNCLMSEDAALAMIIESERLTIEQATQGARVRAKIMPRLRI